MTPPANLKERLLAGCDCSLKCQLLHQRAAEALGKMREALEYFMRAYDGIGADSFDGIEERYVLLLQEGNARARAILQDTLTLTGPNDSASLYAAARAMAEFDWVGEPAADVWAELEACDQEYYLAHARIACGMPVQGTVLL